MLFSFGNHSSEIMHKAGIASSIPALCYLEGEMCEKAYCKQKKMIPAKMIKRIRES